MLYNFDIKKNHNKNNSKAAGKKYGNDGGKSSLLSCVLVFDAALITIRIPRRKSAQKRSPPTAYRLIAAVEKVNMPAVKPTSQRLFPKKFTTNNQRLKPIEILNVTFCVKLRIGIIDNERIEWNSDDRLCNVGYRLSRTWFWRAALIGAGAGCSA